MRAWLALAAVTALALTSLTAWLPAPAAHAALPLGAFGAGIPPPVHHGTLRVSAVRAYPPHRRPATAFVNGTPERHTASAEEYFQVAAPHANAAERLGRLHRRRPVGR